MFLWNQLFPSRLWQRKRLVRVVMPVPTGRSRVSGGSPLPFLSARITEKKKGLRIPSKTDTPYGITPAIKESTEAVHIRFEGTIDDHATRLLVIVRRSVRVIIGDSHRLRAFECSESTCIIADPLFNTRISIFKL
jgi:hypothetical protein